jgi:hypothetical protein
MNSLEQRKYCGLLQNKIQELTGVLCNATSTGYSLSCNEEDYDKIKELNLPFKKEKSGNWYTGYRLMVGKRVLKKIELI